MESDPCLVYLYMPNGSVADRLKRRGGTGPLTWGSRANIALGTARGLCHLHANNIIHGDIKSGNILLDRHFEPKIGESTQKDFEVCTVVSRFNTTIE